MLFCRGPAHLVAQAVRSSGRGRTGRTTLWGRRATRRVRPRWGAHTVGPRRVWRSTRADHTAVARGGLVYRAAGPARPAEYGVTSWGPVRFRRGVTLPLRWAPVGAVVGRVAWAARTAPARVLRHRGDRVELRLASRRSVWVRGAVTGVAHHAGRSSGRPTGSAGAAHRAGRRPRVRGVAMNPVDHPHGGGQGKTSGGRPGVTPWGRLTRGVPTRRR